MVVTGLRILRFVRHNPADAHAPLHFIPLYFANLANLTIAAEN